MMKNYVKINHNPNWPYIHDHSYRILTVGGSGWGKTNVFELNKKSAAGYWSNLLICQRTIWIKVSIAY